MKFARILVGVCSTLVIAGGSQAADNVQFNRDVRPILASHCFACHGPAKQEAGLRLDDRDAAVRATESGARPIVPGQVDSSEVVARILSADPDHVMPPPSTKKGLSAAEKDTLKRWIAEGASYQKHWAFEPPQRREPPRVSAAGSSANGVATKNAVVRNAIDAFLIDRLHREGLTMSPEADRATLLRRVALALTGLPPTVKEQETFFQDREEGGYERMVERYLSSPRYGEEMARHWLDVARYADTHGLHLDNERQMWAYRDWVIRAFNANMPYDQFTIEQLAGDLLPNPSLEQLVATGFNRCNVTTGEGGSIDEEWIFRNALDRTSTMAQAWMGITAGCGVCHNHKFDPLTQRDYYSLYAFFLSASDPPLDGNALLTQPTVKLNGAEQAERLQELDRRMTALEQEVSARIAKLEYVDPATIDPPPAATTIEDVWYDDEFPAGAKVIASPGHPTLVVTADGGRVFSGQKAIKRSDRGLAQDVFEGTSPLEVPQDGILFAHVWVDPADPPKTLMLQYFKGDWLHRAVWGDYGAIDWGRANTTERVGIGPLPEPAKWVKLEVPAAKLGLNAGDKITGFALTQFGGTIFWDRVGIAGTSNPATDPRRSLSAWWKAQQGKDTPGLPGDLAPIVKAGPDPDATKSQRVRDYYLRHICVETRAGLDPQLRELQTIRQQRTDFENAIPATFIFREMEKPRDSFVMLRGQYHQRGEKVEPNVPGFLPPLPPLEGRRANRLDLAKWLLAPDHPLTARVAVNRLWQQLFGVGLVKTSFDFGVQGELPSHPELLDWLAVTYREQGWNTKELVRLLVTSAAFRQASVVTPELLRRDPENRLLARAPRLRLDAEQIRDNSLSVSGLMNPAMGGRGVLPYQPPNIWEPVGFVGSNTATYRQDHGPALYRRSIYVFFKRTAPPPFMSNFDAPNREAFCARRERSNTPLQALQLMNDVQHFESARGLAERMMLEGGANTAERVAFAYRVVLSRDPEAEEVAILQELISQERTRFQQQPEAAEKVIRNGESPVKPELAPAELAAYTMAANLLLNLDETITRN
jgi:hypothetical protein